MSSRSFESSGNTLVWAMADPARDIVTMAERSKARILAFSGEWRGGAIGCAGGPGEYASDG
jgi:hypothetical protein